MAQPTDWSETRLVLTRYDRDFRLVRPLVKSVVALTGLMAAGVYLLSCNQHAMIYHPRPYRVHDLASLPRDVQQLQYQIAAGRQYAFYVPHRTSDVLPKRVWVAFCGNASLALDWLVILSGYPHKRDAFLLIDYPGFGKSEGVATIKNTRDSADMAISLVRARLRLSEAQLDSRLYVIGHSLGAAAAFDFATHHSVRGIVAIAPFTSLQEEAATVVGSTLSHILHENYDNRARLRELVKRVPLPRITLIHGTDDHDIPARMSRELASEFPAVVRFLPIESADHVSVLDLGKEEIFEAMDQ